MELMSSSDDSDADAAPSPPCKRTKTTSMPNCAKEQPTTPPTKNPPKQKPVISARELLLKLLPAGQRQKTIASPAKEKAIEKAVDAYSFLSPKRASASPNSLKPDRELSASERIARKYGLKAAAEATAAKDEKSVSNPENVEESYPIKPKTEYYEPKRRKSPSPKETPVKTKKRSFWEAQTAGLEEEKAAEPHKDYVSPFRSSQGFKDMKLKKRRQRELEQALESDDESQKMLQTTRKKPEHVLGSAIAGPDDADDWFSDSKEIGSDGEVAEEPTNKSVEDNGQALKTAPRPGLNKRRLQVRPRFKKKQQQSSSEEEEESDSRVVEEIWPRLPPPKNDEAAMVLSSEGDAKRYEVCANLNKFLFDYQRDGARFLYSAYKRNTGAVLGDDMGLGKTIQVIAFLSAIMGKHGDRRDKDAWRALLHDRRERYYEGAEKPGEVEFSFGDEVAPVFIVVPASLLQNWEAELHLWMSCHVVILRGKPQDREAIIDQIYRGEYEIVICSYDILKICLKRLHQAPWEVVILDEMHCLKNPEAQLTKAVKAIKCPRKLGLTGTLMQNNETELHCLIDTIAPGALGSLQEFQVYYGNDIKYGRKKSAVPEAVKRSHQKEAALRKVLIPFYLRREKEINPTFQEVSKCDQVVFCDLTPYQLAAYERVLQMPEFQLLRKGDARCDCGRDSRETRKKCCYKTPADLSARGLLWERFHENGACRNCPNCMGLVCVAQLLKLSNHLELIKVNPRDSTELQGYQAAFAAAALGEDVDAVGGVEQVSSFQQMRAIGTQTCGKMVVLEKLLAVWKKRKQRTLIFSRSTRMLDIIQLFLITKATKYSRLDGNTRVEDRLQMVNDFNSPDSNASVFLISTKAGGVGLNLQSATNVVIFDPSWNPAHDCQAQDRAYRIGQTKDVQVYRLITLGTIEEMIYVRQIYKQQLSDTTLKGSKAPRYFEGVQGNPNQRGELFGIANLLCWKPGGVLKDIQDAYQHSRDGLLIQENGIRYDSSAMRNAAKRAKAKAKKQDESMDDEGEMIEVADEMVADMLKEAPPTPAEEQASDHETQSDVNAMLGVAAFSHERIVGEEERERADAEMGDVDTLAELQARFRDESNAGPDNDADALGGMAAFRHEDIVGEQEEQARPNVHQITQSQGDVIVIDGSDSDTVVSTNRNHVHRDAIGAADVVSDDDRSARSHSRPRNVLDTGNTQPTQPRSRLYVPQYL